MARLAGIPVSGSGPRPGVSPSALALLILASALSALAAGAASDDLTDIRREMLGLYHYGPAPAKSETRAPFLAEGASPVPVSQAQPKDVVTMAPFVIEQSIPTNEMQEALDRQEASAVSSGLSRKLGVGIHSVKVGKFRLFAGTIFYVPFVVGAAW